MRSGDTRRAKDRIKGTARVAVPVVRSPAVKPGYSDLRREHLAALVAQIRWTQPPLASVGRVEFEWRGDLRRDRDGVRAASKLVLDALVRAGVLASDKAACVRGPLSDDFAAALPAGVVVRLVDDAVGPVVMWLMGRLPDANEMIEAARLEGARRERYQASLRWRR